MGHARWRGITCVSIHAGLLAGRVLRTTLLSCYRLARRTYMSRCIASAETNGTESWQAGRRVVGTDMMMLRAHSFFDVCRCPTAAARVLVMSAECRLVALSHAGRHAICVMILFARATQQAPGYERPRLVSATSPFDSRPCIHTSRTCFLGIDVRSH